ncbi:MAG TPA: hypothetical protein VFT50_12090 [Baekduia sp.]|nr:hypothetical protein [Baekduia sp.]
MSTEQQHGLRAGHVVALVGALLTLASLWRPWYAIELPQALRDGLASEGARAASAGSLLGSAVQQLAAALPSRIEADGWQVLRGADVALCAVALAAAALVLGAAGALGGAVRVEAGAAGRWTAGVGLIGLVVALAHVVDPPSGGFGIAVRVGDGAWLALVGAAITALGGALAATSGGSAPAAPAVLDLAAPLDGGAADAQRALTSVAPPGA